MPSICVHLYVLGVVLVLYIVNADRVGQTDSNTFTFTSTPTSTPTSTFTSTFTSTPTPTSTFTSTPTSTPTPTPTSTSTSTPTSIPITTPITIPITIPITTPTYTPTHIPSANQNTPTVTTLDHDDNLANNTTIGRDGDQSQTRDEDIGTLLVDPMLYDKTIITTSSPVVSAMIEPTGAGGSVTAGYVILFLILLAVVCLVVVLYNLRKKSRRYSFDLQRAGYDHDTPLTCMEQSGTFEPNEKAAGFEYVREGDGDDHQAMSPVANGSAGEAGSTGETEGEKQGHGDSDGDGDSFNNFCGCEITLTPPVKRVGFSLDLNLDLSDRQSDQSDAGEQNGNNNNIAMGMTPDPPGLTFDPVGPGDVFTEINLDI